MLDLINIYEETINYLKENKNNYTCIINEEYYHILNILNEQFINICYDIVSKNFEKISNSDITKVFNYLKRKRGNIEVVYNSFVNNKFVLNLDIFDHKSSVTNSLFSTLVFWIFFSPKYNNYFLKKYNRSIIHIISIWKNDYLFGNIQTNKLKTNTNIDFINSSKIYNISLIGKNNMLDFSRVTKHLTIHLLKKEKLYIFNDVFFKNINSDYSSFIENINSFKNLTTIVDIYFIMNNDLSEIIQFKNINKTKNLNVLNFNFLFTTFVVYYKSYKLYLYTIENIENKKTIKNINDLFEYPSGYISEINNTEYIESLNTINFDNKLKSIKEKRQLKIYKNIIRIQFLVIIIISKFLIK